MIEVREEVEVDNALKGESLVEVEAITRDCYEQT